MYILGKKYSHYIWVNTVNKKLPSCRLLKRHSGNVPIVPSSGWLINFFNFYMHLNALLVMHIENNVPRWINYFRAWRLYYWIRKIKSKESSDLVHFYIHIYIWILFSCYMTCICLLTLICVSCFYSLINVLPS